MGCVASRLASTAPTSEKSPSFPTTSSLPTRAVNTTTSSSLPITTTSFLPVNTTTSGTSDTSDTNNRFGKCEHCSSPYISYNWCRNCAFPGKEKWTTGNTLLDKFIIYTQEVSPDYETYLEWIPFEQFNNVKEIGKGGFSTVFEAIWIVGPKRNFDRSNKRWCRTGKTKVTLKLLHDSQQITQDFLNDMKKYYHCKNRENLIGYYGISQDPVTKDYILVTQFANRLDLRTCIYTKYSNDIDTLTWNEKINILRSIAELIKSLHNEKSLQGGKLFHGNLHPGNLLKNIDGNLEESILLDMGSCWIPSTSLNSAKQQLNNNNNYLLYGVLPYMAPEILRGEKKSQSADIYNFGMIMWELSTFSLPYFDRAHNLELALEICEGVRPDPLPETPEFYFDLMERCWDDDPSIRPNATEIIRILDMNQLYLKYSEQTMKVEEYQEHSNKLTKISEKITKQVGVMKKKFHFRRGNFLLKDIHPEAYYSSKIFDFSFDRLSISSNSNNSLVAGNTSTSEDFGEETGQSSLAISDVGMDDIIEISEVFALSKDSKGKKKLG